MDDFGTVQFRYMHYMPIQPVLLRYKRVDDFSTASGPFWYIMGSDRKKASNGKCVTHSMFDRDVYGNGMYRRSHVPKWT